MTYLELITNAYRLRNVIDSNQAPSAEQGVAAVTILNQMMAELEADNVPLQYVPILPSQVADTIGIPAYAQGAITAALALRIKAAAPVTPEVIAQYEAGMATVMRISVSALLGANGLASVPSGEGFRHFIDYGSG